MKILAYMLNQLGVVLLGAAAAFVGGVKTNVFEDVFILSVSVIGFMLISASMILVYVLNRHSEKHKLEIYDAIGFIICEVGLANVANGLSFMYSGGYLYGGVYLMISAIMIVAFIKYMVIFKRFFFDAD